MYVWLTFNTNVSQHFKKGKKLPLEFSEIPPSRLKYHRCTQRFTATNPSLVRFTVQFNELWIPSSSVKSPRQIEQAEIIPTFENQLLETTYSTVPHRNLLACGLVPRPKPMWAEMYLKQRDDDTSFFWGGGNTFKFSSTLLRSGILDRLQRMERAHTLSGPKNSRLEGKSGHNACWKPNSCSL